MWPTMFPSPSLAGQHKGRSVGRVLYYRQTFPTRATARFAVAEYIEVFSTAIDCIPFLGYRTPFQALNDHQTATPVAA